MLPWHVLAVLLFWPMEAPVDLWNYDDTTLWPETFPLCGGPRQSPIALSGDRLAVSPPVRVSAPADDRPVRVRAFNTGRRVELRFGAENDSAPAVQLASEFRPLVGTFALEELHFHWGDARGTPGSEHAIDGAFFEAEAHVVFFNRYFGSFERAVRYPGGVAVVAVPLRGARPPAPGPVFPTFGLEARLDELAGRDDEVTFSADLAPLLHLLRAALAEVLAYKGSLTTPPCSPVVTWLVSTRVAALDAGFLRGLVTRVFQDRERTRPLINNWRPLQDDQGRLVTKYRAKLGPPYPAPAHRPSLGPVRALHAELSLVGEALTEA